MTAAVTVDTSQLHALAARHGLKLHGPLTVNELGLDYRVVIATVDDGRRWVLRIPRRAEVSAKVEPEARVLAMLKKRLPFAVPEDAPMFGALAQRPPTGLVHARLGRAAGLGGLRGELRDGARRPARRPRLRRRRCGDAHPHAAAGPSEGGRRR